MKWISFVILAFFCACNEREGDILYGGAGIETEAVVRWTGDPAADGCDWLIDVKGTLYRADKLPGRFREANLNVNLRYMLTEEGYHCGIGASRYAVIHIFSISR